MHYPVKLATLLMVFLSYGCAPTGGGEEDSASSGSTSGDTVITATEDLVASSTFNFRSDRSIAISFEDFPSETGKFVVYSQFDHFDAQANTYYPDYSTRLASFVANPELVYELVIPSSQQFLVLEWLPMDGLSHEQYQLLALNSNDQYSASF